MNAAHLHEGIHSVYCLTGENAIGGHSSGPINDAILS